jgi:ATP-dependent helicase/nuclease subunit B
LRNAAPGDLALVEATDPEHEAQCADLAVREALLAGARRVAVVCNDRRLARRLRARLERAHLPLIDRGGWALSTSRAAATLDAWLDCAEQDFPWRPLFALLKSGFYPQGPAWAERLEPSAWKLAIAGGASRWREAVDSGDRARWEQLARAAAALSTVSGTHPATAHVDGLLESLRRLGLDTALASDRAGASLMARLQELRAALEGTALRLSWPAFRALLDRALEDASFPGEPVAASAVEVQLLTLDQSAGLRADAVVITGATPALLAGAESPFFNAAVRRELGLPTSAETQVLRLARLVAVLQAAPRVRVLYAPEAAGEDALLAAPLLALQAFAAAAGVPLVLDTGLAARAARAEIAADSVAPEPATRAAPPASATLLARPLSASGHQMLLDCPYRFHARYALGLIQLEAPDTPPDRRDYGERVHRILRAFEEPLDDLPPPWTGPRDATQQPAMAEHLQRLAQAVFAPDLASRPLARFWLQGFTKAIPWLTQQFTEWPQAATRVEVELSIHRDGWKLVGRADRLDLTPDHGRVVDYKTGTLPSADALATGEAVQLPHYALLAAAADRVEYWDLKRQTTRALDRESLDTLKPLLAERLSSLAIAIERGAALPAHGAATVCERCEFIGVCRRLDQP